VRQHSDETDYSDDEGPQGKTDEAELQREVTKIMKKSRLSEKEIRFVVENFPSADFPDEDSDGLSDFNDDESSDSDEESTHDDVPVEELVEVEVPAPDTFSAVRIFV
jgi:hypothetical protein